MVGGGIIPGGEEEVTRDEVLLMSESLEQHSTAFPAYQTMTTATKGGTRITKSLHLAKFGIGHVVRSPQSTMACILGRAVLGATIEAELVQAIPWPRSVKKVRYS